MHGQVVVRQLRPSRVSAEAHAQWEQWKWAQGSERGARCWKALAKSLLYYSRSQRSCGVEPRASTSLPDRFGVEKHLVQQLRLPSGTSGML